MYLRTRIAKGWGGPPLFCGWSRSVPCGAAGVVSANRWRTPESLDEQGAHFLRVPFCFSNIGTPESGQFVFNDGTSQLTVPVRLKGHSASSAHVQFGDVYLATRGCGAAGTRSLCERLLPLGRSVPLFKDGGSPGDSHIFVNHQRITYCRGLVSTNANSSDFVYNLGIGGQQGSPSLSRA